MKLLLENIQYEKYNWTFVDIERSIISSLVTQSFVAFCVNGIAGTENIITTKKIGPKENSLFQDRKV